MAQANAYAAAILDNAQDRHQPIDAATVDSIRASSERILAKLTEASRV